MRDFFRVINLLFIGLFAAILVYPVLHESGHFLFAFLSGANIIEISLLPLPSVLCQMNMSDPMSVVFTGLGGIIIPFVATIVVPSQKFVTWYLWTVLKGICLISVMISIVGIYLFKVGKPIVNEDITKIMITAPQYSAVYCAILLFMLVIICIQIVKSEPIKRCMKYFEIE